MVIGPDAGHPVGARSRSDRADSDHTSARRKALPRELSILVVANRTAKSESLEDAMRARAQECERMLTRVFKNGVTPPTVS